MVNFPFWEGHECIFGFSRKATLSFTFQHPTKSSIMSPPISFIFFSISSNSHSSPSTSKSPKTIFQVLYKICCSFVEKICHLKVSFITTPYNNVLLWQRTRISYLKSKVIIDEKSTFFKNKSCAWILKLGQKML